MKKYLLGIDVGTTGTKTLLFRADGQLIGHAYEAYPLLTPQVGWSEQRAEDWWQAVVHTVRQVCEDPDVAKNVAGISLSLQGGTFVPTDADGRALRPAIVWNDERTAKEREAFLREVGTDEDMYQKTGWHLGLGLLAQEIRWMKDNEPELFQKTAMFLSVPSYISYRMTGVAACDLSDAGIDQLADIRRGAYDEALLAYAGISAEQLPKLVRSGDRIGQLTPQAAQALGLTTDCVLVAGAHDQYAVALGAGAVRPGDILIGSGTCWVITAIGDAPDFSSGLSQSVAAVPGLWGSLRSLSSGGVCLDWLRKFVAVGSDSEPVGYETLNREAAARRAADDGLFFVPFQGYAGQKRFSKASFIGMDLSHDRFHMARAIMEGIVFQVIWMMEAFRSKPSSDGLKLAGGASKSPLWCQITADISGLPVRVPAVADLACVGAAILAGVGTGIYQNAEEGYKHLAIDERVIMPDPERSAEYRRLLPAYKRSVQALGDVYGL